MYSRKITKHTDRHQPKLHSAHTIAHPNYELQTTARGAEIGKRIRDAKSLTSPIFILVTRALRHYY